MVDGRCIVQVPVLIVATKRDLADGMGDDSSLEDMIWEHTRPLLTDFGVRCGAALVASTAFPQCALPVLSQG